MTDGVAIGPGKGGLERVLVDRREAKGEIYLHGATVTGWTPFAAGPTPVIFLSPLAAFRPDKAIRGGVPICFPWFGPKAGDQKAPQHGFARTSAWTLAGVGDDPKTRTVTVELELASSDRTRTLWPHSFKARYAVTFGAKLELALTVENTSEAPFVFEEALHTYLAVGDVEEVRIRGLAGTTYADKVAGGAMKTEREAEIALRGEVDRLYLGTRDACEVHDRSTKRIISVAKDGSASTVVWNPGAEKARLLSDLGDTAWRSMVCLETANAAADAITLAPGSAHTMRALLVVNARA